MSARPPATWPENGPSSPMKKVVAKRKSAMGTSTAPVPNESMSAWPTALVTTALEGETTETNMATAMTATTTPAMSRCASVSMSSRGAAALPRPFEPFFAAFLLRLAGMR